ncbi:MAG: response regulator transcription factor [Blastocatellia bacterium]
MKLLIVEDNLPIRRLIRRLVGDLADEIGECGDGVEAEALYAELLPDWVLMDIEMPRVNGIAATRRIKAAFPEARIVIVTNYDDAALRAAALAAGACGYVLKENLLELRQLLR